VLNLFKFFQLEKSRGRPLYSPENLIKRTCKAAGISYSSVYRVANGSNKVKVSVDFEILILSSISFLIFETVGAIFLLYML
jgi:hypothetical protein